MTTKNKEKTKKKPANGFDKRKDDINRNGRPPKGTSITEILRAYLEEPADKKGITRKEELAQLLYKLSKTDLMALKYLMNRIDGKPKEEQKVELSAESELKVTINLKGE